MKANITTSIMNRFSFLVHERKYRNSIVSDTNPMINTTVQVNKSCKYRNAMAVIA